MNEIIMLLHIQSSDHENQITALRTLFESGLKIAYGSERQLENAYAGLRMQLQDREAAALLMQHETTARSHADRIEKIFESIGIAREEKENQSLLILEAALADVVQCTPRNAVRDAALIAVIQQMLHAQIATYGTLRAFALALKEEEVVELLGKSLDEEKLHDAGWSALAQAGINDEAANKEY
jgi:ferritin-like metal-binding protein YciE